MASAGAPMDEEPPAIRVLNVPTLQDEEIPFELDQLWADPAETENTYNELIGLFEAERVPGQFWLRLAEECMRVGRSNLALGALDRATNAVTYDERVAVLCMKATYLQVLARKAPKSLLATPRAGLPLFHSQHPDHPESAIDDPEAPPYSKEDYWKRAADCINQAERIVPQHPVLLDCKGALLVARGRLDEAAKVFEAILAVEPTNVLALSGRARVLYAKRSYRPALKGYQSVLQLAPSFLPDPRIGIGMCLWSLGDRDRARKAWERSIAVNPNSGSNSATLLLGLSHINASKDPTVLGGLEARAVSFEKGFALVQQAFKQDNTSAAAAVAIGAHLLTLGQREKALKVAERAVQFADSRVLLAEGHLLIGRALSQGGVDELEAIQEYTNATLANPDQLQGLLATAQTLASVNQLAAAIDKFEQILKRHPRCIEALVALAAIHSHQTFSTSNSVDSAAERKKAKELYEQVLKLIAISQEAAPAQADLALAKSERVRVIAADIDVYLEVAELWDDESASDKTLNAYREAFALAEEEAKEGASAAATERLPKLLNNLGVLEFQRGDFATALDKFQQALIVVAPTIVNGTPSLAQDAVLTPTTFNVGTAYEALGESDQAKASYEQVLKVHPEYVDAKARLALMAMTSSGPHRGARLSYADNLLKEALTAFPASLELRALYTFFLIETAQSRAARDFARATLKEHNKHDLYALCAVGLLQYLDAREMKGNERDRNDKFARAAEFYDKALSLSTSCAFAAHGLAISIAEGTIPSGADTATGQSAGQKDQGEKQRNSRDALSILTKVKESINDASVYINLGHVHFLREEFDRAIESYETANKRNKGQSVSTLLYLARAWYHKANKLSSYEGIRSALEACQAAAALRPEDLAIQFNLGLVLQKGAEMLSSLPVEKRTLEQLEQAQQDNEASTVIFEKLVAVEGQQTPYSKEVADQRRRYGGTLTRRLPEVLELQREHEAEEKARVAAALEVREGERRAREEQMAAVLREKEEREERLREQRRLMREQEEEASRRRREIDEQEDSDEDRKRAKRSEKKRVKKAESGESEDDEVEKPKTKKPKKPKKVKKKIRESDDEGEQMDLDKAPAAGAGSDEDEPVRARGRASKKANKFRSAEFIQDSDEESEGDAPAQESEDE